MAYRRIPAARAALDGRPEVIYLGSAAYRESFSIYSAGNNLTIAASGIMTVTAIPLYAGDVITSLSFASGATGLTQGTNNDGHWWFALYDPSIHLLAQTADRAAAAWASITVMTLALSSPQTITSTGLYYAAVMINPGTGGSPTVPTLRGALLNSGAVSNVTGWPTGRKMLAGQNGSGLTTTAPAGPLTLSATVVNPPYVLAT
jgi:hypothetical protein